MWLGNQLNSRIRFETRNSSTRLPGNAKNCSAQQPKSGNYLSDCPQLAFWQIEKAFSKCKTSVWNSKSTSMTLQAVNAKLETQRSVTDHGLPCKRVCWSAIAQLETNSEFLIFVNNYFLELSKLQPVLNDLTDSMISSWEFSFRSMK